MTALADPGHPADLQTHLTLWLPGGAPYPHMQMSEGDGFADRRVVCGGNISSTITGADTGKFRVSFEINVGATNAARPMSAHLIWRW